MQAKKSVNMTKGFYRMGLLLALVLGFLASSVTSAREMIGYERVAKPKKKTVRKGAIRGADCDPASSQVDLDINNVRARILGGGDMWWDLIGNAQYEVPKGSGKHAMFAAAIWIGGFDPSGNLRLAAQTYRQSGNDFWPGPLLNGTVDNQTCREWDKHFKVLRSEIDAFLADYQDNGVIDEPIPLSIREWPAVGNPFTTRDDKFIGRPYGLAPFVDVDGDGLYNPTKGDYPDVPGDMAIWWVYNDKGNIHGETNAEPIGIEIQALAFAFQTNDEINDMTFYKYVLINHATTTLDSAYIAQWVDPDLGCYQNDYVGCDTILSLGFVYNGTLPDVDCGSPGYEPLRPAAGTDFFKGPYDPDKQEYLGMSAFIYFNNDFSVTGNPTDGIHFYNYMSGSWKDGSPVTFGGNGYGGTQRTNYMFPSDPSDPTGWSECSAGNQPADRRYVMSSGPFRLLPGAVNEVVIGAVWANDPTWTLCAPLTVLKAADEKAQTLFDLNFQLLDGPEAPNMTIRELDRKLVITLWNRKGSNNENEDFRIVDKINITDIRRLGSPDSFYKFEGYLIYQLAGPDVTARELNDPTRARLIAQFDIENGIKTLVNWTFDKDNQAWIPEVKVEGADKGIKHTIVVTQDAFGKGGATTLINNRPYYFMVIAYAANRFRKFVPGDTLPGQTVEFLPGRKNVRVYTAIPHKPITYQFGTRLNSNYGDGPIVKRLAGGGAAGATLEFTDEAHNLLSAIDPASPDAAKSQYAYYKPRTAPIDVQVVDPLKVVPSTYRVYIKPAALALAGIENRPVNPGDTTFYIYDVDAGQIVYADVVDTVYLGFDGANDVYEYRATIQRLNEYVLQDRGISLTFKQYKPLKEQILEGRGIVEASITFADVNQQWLIGVNDDDGFSLLDWIKSGNTRGNYNKARGSLTSVGDYEYDLDTALGSVYFDSLDIRFMDPEAIFEATNIKWFAPYMLANGDRTAGLAPAIMEDDPANYYLTDINTLLDFYSARKSFDDLFSFELVITPDKSKWSRAPVLEAGDDPSLTEGGALRFTLRRHAGLNIDGTYSSSPLDTGMGYFPGYAINLETGERVIILYAENSIEGAHNGRDMIWNPTSTVFERAGNNFDIVAGGEHYIYITNLPYTNTYLNILKTMLKSAAEGWDTVLAKYIQWVGVPLLAPGFEWKPMSEGLVPTEVRIRYIVSKPFYRVVQPNALNDGYPVYEFSMAGFEPTIGDDSIKSTLLDSIRIVPNPYYGYSEYEDSRIDNRIKIINLPPKAEIAIYSIDGTLIKNLYYESVTDNLLGDDGDEGAIEWDLTNNAGIPISSGLYLIHVKVPEVGDKILKFFAIMRPVDLQSF